MFRLSRIITPNWRHGASPTAVAIITPSPRSLRPFRHLNAPSLRLPHTVRTKAMTVTPKTATPTELRPVGYWLLGCAGMVVTMVTVGGITRITRSGLSMTDWKPHGGLPPITHAEWQVEFDKYKTFPEYSQRHNMSLSEFKRIYYWEYSHRMLGRVLGLTFVLPATYFALTRTLPSPLKRRLGLLLGLGATQGAIGWWMVKSGLEMSETERQEIRVSPYRLATHLSMAFTTYGLLLWSGLDLLSRDQVQRQRAMMDAVVLKSAGRIRRIAQLTTACVAITVFSGAFVAGTDAGHAYNTFPKMNDHWIPPEAFVLTPFYKNIFEDPTTIQFDHRVLALTTLTGITAMTVLARQRYIWSQLPVSTRVALTATAAAAWGQVTLGVVTLLSQCHIPLAITHQAGSLVLLSANLSALHTLRFAITKK